MALNSTPPHLSKQNGAKIAVALSFVSLELTVSASAGSVAVPADETARSFGYGWDCQTGYIQDGDACRAIIKSANAFLTGSSFGKGWSCRRGFREDGDQCKKNDLPSNAFLNDRTYGDGWGCERANSCEEVFVPADGYLNDRSTDWKCSAPYRRKGGAFVPS